MAVAMSSSVGAEDDDKVFSAVAAAGTTPCSLPPPSAMAFAPSDNICGWAFSPQTGGAFTVVCVSERQKEKSVMVVYYYILLARFNFFSKARTDFVQRPAALKT